MASPSCILSVGTNPVLMSSRALILRGAGYVVKEAYSLEKAIKVIEKDFLDAMLICHTVPRKDQQVLISAAREKSSQMPILCLRSYVYESIPKTCIAVDSDPEALLNAVRNSIIPPKPDSLA
jgi:CheY-like chemotaxis protein